MKTLLIIAAVLYVTNGVLAQVPVPAPNPPQLVKDITNNKLNTKLVALNKKARIDQIRAIAQDAETLLTIQKTLEFAKKMNEYRKEVSRFIKTTKRLATIVNSQVELAEAYQKYGVTMDFDNIMEFTSEEERSGIKKRYKKIMEDSDKDIDELAAVLTPGELKMADYERMQAVNKIEKRMLYRAYKVKTLTNKIKSKIRTNRRKEEFVTLNKGLF